MHITGSNEPQKLVEDFFIYCTINCKIKYIALKKCFFNGLSDFKIYQAKLIFLPEIIFE